LQLKAALNYFDAEDYKRALTEFKKLLAYYPDAREAAEAQFYKARCYEGLNHHYQAFKEYQRLIARYPNSMRIQEATERQYKIGEWFLTWKGKRLLGVPLNVFSDHPAIEIFTKIVEVVPYSEYAPKSLYKLGTLFVNLSRYDEAKEAFQRLIDNYPKSEWAEAAKYQLALSSSKSSLAAEYDQSATQEARVRFEEFLRKHPDAKISQEASKELSALKERQAKNNFDTAVFYEKQKRFQSALIYYQIVVDNYPESEVAELAKEKIESLKKVLE